MERRHHIIQSSRASKSFITFSQHNSIDINITSKTYALTIHFPHPFLTTLTPIYSHQVVPTSCKAHVCVAAAYNDLNTKEARINAMPHLKKAFEIKPNYAGAHFMQGTIHRELGDKEKAATSFQAVIQHSSETEYKPDVLYLGLVRENLNADYPPYYCCYFLT